MGNGGKTTERLVLANGEDAPDEANTFAHGDIFGVKGKAFYEGFMANFVNPQRRELANMLIASQVQHGGLGSVGKIEVEFAFDVADVMIRAEFDTLDMEAYWKLFLDGPASKDRHEVLKAMVDGAQDYSIR